MTDSADVDGLKFFIQVCKLPAPEIIEVWIGFNLNMFTVKCVFMALW